jgi:hypothetical protein
MLVIAIILFFILFFMVGTYKECSTGVTKAGGGFAGRAYSLDPFLDDQYDQTHPYTRLEGPFTRCSPESHPYGCGTDASKIIVYGKGVQGIPHVKKELYQYNKNLSNFNPPAKPWVYS